MGSAVTAGDSAVNATTVLLVHEDDVFLWGLQRLIEKQEPRLVHAGTASTVNDALALLPHVRPRVILLDLELSGSSDLHVLSTIVQASKAPVIAFTSSRNPETVQA